MEGEADTIVDEYADDGVQFLIVIEETSDFIAPDQDNCQALQTTQKATVLYDTARLAMSTLDLTVNGGAALSDQDGIWITAPGGGSMLDVENALSDMFGGNL